MPDDLANNKAHGQHDSASDHASKVFEESSVCAVSTILSTNNKRRKIFRSVIFVLFTIAFFYQLIAFLCYAFQYPTIVDRETVIPETFVSPAFTFCNYNIVKRSKFCEKYPGNCTKPNKQFCSENPRFCGTPDTRILKDDNFDLEDLEELYQLRHDVKDIVEFDDDDKHKPVGPLAREHLNEMDIAACFSYFDRVDSPLDPYMKVITPIGIGNSEMVSLDPQENELIYPEAEPGIMFDVHSPFEGSNPFKTGIFMRPGRLYRINVKMTQEEILTSDCLNYTELWLKNNRKGYRSQVACKQKCIGDLVVKCFKCFEPVILYPYPKAKYCAFGPERMVNLTTECEDPDDEIIECFKECKEECLKTKYSYEVQENVRNRYAHGLKRNESRTIAVVMEFPDMNIQKIVHKPQFQVLEVFSLIGGLLAFWIGLSMYQFVEVFDCIFQIGEYIWKRRSAVTESSSA